MLIEKNNLFPKGVKILCNIYVFRKVYSEGNPIIVEIKFHNVTNKLQSADVGFIEMV